MKSTSTGQFDGAHEVGHEVDGALQDADEQRRAVRVVLGDLARPSSPTRSWTSLAETTTSPRS